MKLKPLAIALSLAAASYLSPAAEANIPPEGCAIGDVYYGISMDDVIEYVGEPDRTYNNVQHPRFRARDTQKFVYSSGYIIFEKGIVRECHVTTHNPDLATPGGIMVGSRLRDVEREYGFPNTQYKEGRNTYYVYECDGVTAEMQFVADRNDKIVEIAFITAY